MHVKRTAVLAIVAAAVSSLVIACANPGGTSSPSDAQSQGVGAGVGIAPTGLGSQPLGIAHSGPTTRLINMMDACDGPSFNLAIGPGTCSRNGGVNFSEFVAQLTANQSAGAWHNAPSQTDAWLNDSLVAANKGGEMHTFTRVASFGGGIVPFLNQLAGTPTVAPECETENVFVPPGGTDTESLDQTGEIKFQCCIHPWMRTTVLVQSH
jgi:hypothetical protein